MEPMKPMTPMAPMKPMEFGPPWWPASLGTPSTSGGQNDIRYAFFPTKQRLAIQRDGRLSLYDSGKHEITGVSQQQGGKDTLEFSTPSGSVNVANLAEVSGE